jgi:hypothetical protein
MGTSLDMEQIARELGAERCGKVSARGGYFGALQLAADVGARFRVLLLERAVQAVMRHEQAGRADGAS